MFFENILQLQVRKNEIKVLYLQVIFEQYHDLFQNNQHTSNFSNHFGNWFVKKKIELYEIIWF